MAASSPRALTSPRVTRIHLVIDVQPAAELLGCFPVTFRAEEVLRNTVLSVPPAPLSTSELRQYSCEFVMPEGFLSFEERKRTIQVWTDSGAVTYTLRARVGDQMRVVTLLATRRVAR